MGHSARWGRATCDAYVIDTSCLFLNATIRELFLIVKRFFLDTVIGLF